MIKVYQKMVQDVPILEVVQQTLSNNPLPLVVFYHGWRSSKEQVLTQARKLAKKNIRVILPDAINHGQRLADVSSIPSFTFWNSIQGNIAEFALLKNHYADQQLIKDNKIGVGGYSMGGMTTGALLTAHPEITAATIIMGTPNLTGYSQLVRLDAERRNVYLPSDMMFITDWIKHYDLNLHPEKIDHRPLLFWHGTNDYRIPYQQARNFFNKVHQESYGDQVAFITGYKAGHLVEPPLMDKIANFFEYYLE